MSASLLHTTLREYGRRLLRAKDGRGEWRAERSIRDALVRQGLSQREAQQLMQEQAAVVQTIKLASGMDGRNG